MKYKQPINNSEFSKQYGSNTTSGEKSRDQFYPFDMSEIITSEADKIEAYYANRYKWSNS